MSTQANRLRQRRAAGRDTGLRKAPEISHVAAGLLSGGVDALSDAVVYPGLAANWVAGRVGIRTPDEEARASRALHSFQETPPYLSKEMQYVLKRARERNKKSNFVGQVATGGAAATMFRKLIKRDFEDIPRLLRPGTSPRANRAQQRYEYGPTWGKLRPSKGGQRVFPNATTPKVFAAGATAAAAKEAGVEPVIDNAAASNEQRFIDNLRLRNLRRTPRQRNNLRSPPQ